MQRHPHLLTLHLEYDTLRFYCKVLLFELSFCDISVHHFVSCIDWTLTTTNLPQKRSNNHSDLMSTLNRHAFQRIGQRYLSTTSRPFQILGLQQIAIGALTKEPLHRLWCDTFGLTTVGNFVSETENVDEDILRLGNGVLAVEVDLMTPMDPEKSPKVGSTESSLIGTFAWKFFLTFI
jgi:hypothetical protein